MYAGHFYPGRMKTTIRIVALCLFLVALNAFAVKVETYSTSSKNVAIVETESSVSSNSTSKGPTSGTAICSAARPAT